MSEKLLRMVWMAEDEDRNLNNVKYLYRRD